MHKKAKIRQKVFALFVKKKVLTMWSICAIIVTVHKYQSTALYDLTEIKGGNSRNGKIAAAAFR